MDVMFNYAVNFVYSCKSIREHGFFDELYLYLDLHARATIMAVYRQKKVANTNFAVPNSELDLHKLE